MNRFAAAFSQHPVAAHAVGEVAGAVFDELGVAPDVVAIFVTAPHTGTLEDIAAALQRLLEPRVMIGATAVAVLANGVEIEEGPAVAVWAAKLGDAVRSVRITADQTDDGWAFDGLDALDAGRAVVLVGDPYTFPTEEFLAVVAERRPDLPVIGGMASAARGPGGNRLIVDGVVTTHGAVGFVVGDAGEPETVVSQGCRPIGQPYTVTRAERNMIYELGGQPALERLMSMVDALSSDERALASHGLHCGVVIDEHRVDFGAGDFLVRNVLGADRDNGAVAVGAVVPVGATVQFQVRDADTAHRELVDLLTGRQAAAALVFTCNGRGTNLFTTPNHDAALVGQLLDTTAVAGMFCAGELGPVGGHNFLHGFTASVALFGV
jgi:small ligand-binding sensory domain FIST